MKVKTLILLGIVVLVGCATIMHGTRQDIGLSSSPTGASITVDGNPFGKTPAIVRLSRGRGHIISIYADGYLPFEITLTKHVSGWVWGNLVFGGLIGLVVDAASGGLYYLSPEQVYAKLSKKEVSLKGNYLYFAIVLHPDKDWKKIGNLKKRT